MPKRNATAAVIGAGDFIGSEIAKKFAAEGFTVFAGRRNGDKLAPLVKDIEAAGGEIHARSLDARKEEESSPSSTTPTSMRRSRSASSMSAPTSISRFSTPPNACFGKCGRCLLFRLPCGARGGAADAARGGGNIFFTGATASLRGGSGFAAFASAKFGLRAVAQAMARELGPKNIHVAHLIIDSGVDTEWVRQRRLEALGPDALDNPDLLMPPSSVADAYWQLYRQPKSAWTFEMEIRPFGEKW